MKATKIIIEFEDGSTHYVNDSLSIRAIGLSLPKKNIQWKQTKPIVSKQHQYFAMLSELAKHSGYSKETLHAIMKPLIMKKFEDFPHYYTNKIVEYSTKNLTQEGWSAMLDGLKENANDIYGFSF